MLVQIYALGYQVRLWDTGQGEGWSTSLEEQIEGNAAQQ